MADQPHVSANIDRFLGFAADYDRYRPAPPAAILGVLKQLARTSRPACVVDIASGTGLSTRLWVDHADQVIGIEPNDDMRQIAVARSADMPNVRYQKGLASATDLPTASADIVTISQALHWLEPDPTFAEVARLLRPGGVFAAIDHDFLPTFNWEAELAHQALMATAESVGERLEQTGQRWSKGEHLTRMAASGAFRYTKEVAFDHIEPGSAERMIGLALSYAGMQQRLNAGHTEDEIGMTQFRADVKRILGDETTFWHFTYRVRIGVT